MPYPTTVQVGIKVLQGERDMAAHNKYDPDPAPHTQYPTPRP